MRLSVFSYSIWLHQIQTLPACINTWLVLSEQSAHSLRAQTAGLEHLCLPNNTDDDDNNETALRAVNTRQARALIPWERLSMEEKQ